MPDGWKTVEEELAEPSPSCIEGGVTIGAGPTGLAASKAVLDTLHHFEA
jgi:hypothetical protein